MSGTAVTGQPGRPPAEDRAEATVGWRVTAAHQRAVLLGGAGLLGAVLLRRLDLLVLATPLLVVATWGRVARPRHTVSVRARIGHRRLPEGAATRWSVAVDVPEGGDETTVRLSPGQFVDVDPRTDGACRGRPHDGRLEVSVVARATRWGLRRIGPGLVRVRSPWWAYRTDPAVVGWFEAVATPTVAGFDASVPTPHPEGLVGVNRSARAGTGSEFASIRPFQVGDRLRRIHWPSSLREGTLQVRTNHADQDAHVVLVVDAFSDLGPREGVDGRATSLDVTVRACAAIARHHLAAGDRVSLRVLGADRVPRLGTGSGLGHAHRVLDVLARIAPATDRQLQTVRALEGLVSGSLVVVLTPLVHPAMVGVVAAVAARGLATVVVDTMPEHLWTDQLDPYAANAWRLRRLDRRAEVHRLQQAGVPVVPWAGPGSLDTVLRDLARRARAPRLVRR